MFEDDDDRLYQVVRNDEEQYSIWPVSHDLPPGWQTDGIRGDKATCLRHISEVWTDLRPLSARSG